MAILRLTTPTRLAHRHTYMHPASRIRLVWGVMRFGACTVLTMSLTDVPDGPVWRQLSANVAKAIAQVRRTRTCRVGVVVLSPCCNIRVFLPTQHWRETEVAQIAAFSANAISVVELDYRSNDQTVFGALGSCAAVHRMRRWFAVVIPALSCLVCDDSSKAVRAAVPDSS